MDLAQGVITNSSIQKVEQIEGDHNLHLTNTTELVNRIKNFLVSNI